MTFTLKGKLIDPATNKSLSYHTIKVFDKDPFFDILGDDPLGTVVTLDDGTFRIEFRKEDFRKPLETWETSPNAPELYLKVFGPDGNLIHETPCRAAQAVQIAVRPDRILKLRQNQRRAGGWPRQPPTPCRGK